MMLTRIVAIVLAGLLSINAATAHDCDFSTRAAVEAALIDYDAFLAQGRAEVAIGEGRCTRITNICDRYLVITPCDSVTYAHPGNDALNPLSIVFKNGEEGCAELACEDTFLSAAMIFEPDERYRPAVELIRNDSARWQRTDGVDTRFGFDKTISAASQLQKLLDTITAPDSKMRTLVDMGLPWHSSFTRRPEGAEDYVKTWAYRDSVVMAQDVAACGGRCAMKLFLIKFQEADASPSSALRISGNMVKYEHMVLHTAARAVTSPYDRTISFTLVVP